MVFARMRLVPLAAGESDLSDDDSGGDLAEIGDGGEKLASFAKALTQSDANNGGGFSVPIYCAETIFPRLDYRNCSVDEAEDDDTFQYDSGEKFDEALTVAVPLTVVRANYLFSSVGNGDCGFQFLHDMAFELSVLHGAGLPTSLNQPPPPD